MKQGIFIALILGCFAALGALTACTTNIDKEYKMNVIEIVQADDGNILAYCEPAKLMKMKHYVDIPDDLESYNDIKTFIATQGQEKSYFLVETKKVNDGKYKFLKWE